jgi:hypothetical protein
MQQLPTADGPTYEAPSVLRGLAWGFLIVLIVGYPWMVGVKDLATSVLHLLHR